MNSSRRSKHIHQVTLDRILEENNWLCVYCGGLAGVVDHVIPWSASKDSRDDNLVASCTLCNQAAYAWVFPSLEHKRRYILLRRFGKRCDFVAYRDEHAVRIP